MLDNKDEGLHCGLTLWAYTVGLHCGFTLWVYIVGLHWKLTALGAYSTVGWGMGRINFPY
jgi:hypothetical protein